MYLRYLNEDGRPVEQRNGRRIVRMSMADAQKYIKDKKSAKPRGAKQDGIQNKSR